MQIPPAFRLRKFRIYWIGTVIGWMGNQIFFSGGPFLGNVKSGFLGGVIGVPLAVALGGIANVFAVGWIASRWKELRAYDCPFPT